MFVPELLPFGCRGGNEIKIRSSNPHSLWDGLLGRDKTVSSIEGRAIVTCEADGALEQKSPSNWLLEGHEIAKVAVYDSNVRAAIRAVAAQKTTGGMPVSWLNVVRLKLGFD